MILQDRIPYDIRQTPKLPGIKPLNPEDWLQVYEAYGAQMARRRHLLDTRRDAVLALDTQALPAAWELSERVLSSLPEGFTVTERAVLCPDGTTVARDDKDPLGTLGRIVQEDLCLMEKRGAEHVLTGAVLCFPASWRLDEKFMRPMTAIHDPVDSYDDDIARRVQRLFDGVRAGHPLWRFNAFPYASAELHQPRYLSERRAEVDPRSAPYWRSERQCLVRLPETQAVVFSIHTYVVQGTTVTAETG
ncbi:DUF3445 domain-containing protein [Antarctobacter sp.]|uniref:heme-dependent oxidative N-demethylase family protein n=1 Tax=Antarctobacter sp. TaxID=1872577 RepID=UPI002B26F0AD|nr:DUF3445 domain-containing protein [Antarctobacter sp.]